jgi:hypothetical protein
MTKICVLSSLVEPAVRNRWLSVKGVWDTFAAARLKKSEEKRGTAINYFYLVIT